MKLKLLLSSRINLRRLKRTGGRGGKFDDCYQCSGAG